MKRRTTQRITTLDRFPTSQVHNDAVLLILLLRLRRDSRAGCCQRQARLIVDRAAWNGARNIKHTLVVLISASSVSLQAKVGFRDIVVGRKNLNLEQYDNKRERGDAQTCLKVTRRFDERLGLNLAYRLSSDRRQNAQAGEVRQHC